jgi:hypothetical protein
MRRSGRFTTAFYAVNDRDAFFEALASVRAKVLAGASPIIHVEAHGHPTGIELASSEQIPWQDLYSPLVDINTLTRFNLLLIMAMCHGSHLARAMRITAPSPVWGVLGPKMPVGATSLYRGMAAHYQSLLAPLDTGQELDGSAALRFLNAAQRDSDWQYDLIPAEAFFHSVLRAFIDNLRTPTNARAYVNDFVAQYIRDNDGDVTAGMIARAIANEQLADDHRWYSRFREIFLMLDRFPENRSRLRMSYQDYLDWRPAPATT